MKRYWVVITFIVYAVLMGWFGFRESWWLWGLGMVLGWLLSVIDRLLYVWWSKPYEQLSIQIHYWWKKRALGAVVKLLMERGNEQTKLVFKSMGFALIWPLLAIYIFTSTASVIAMGMVMGLGLLLVLSFIYDWSDWRIIKQWFWWQVKRDIQEIELRLIVGMFMLIWLCLSVVVLWR